MTGKIHVGTSGWHYKHWLDTWYPQGTLATQQFACYREHFKTVEINNSFYRLPTLDTVKLWREAAPPGFIYAVKASRYITHVCRLKDAEASLANFMTNIAALNEKLGPVLFQLPPDCKINTERLAEFLQILPLRRRYTFEFLNPSWHEEKVYALLKQHDCAFCIDETASDLTPSDITSSFVYARLHGPKGKEQGSYTEKALQQWADKCRACAEAGKDVFVYFDNDEAGYAAFNAQRLAQLLAA